MKITLICLIFLGLFYIAYKARPASNKSGSDIHAPKNWHSKEKTQLKIGTYNIQSGKNIDGKRDISRSAAIMSQADIVGVQEVYAKPWFARQGQAQTLAEYSDFGWLFAATRLRWFREHRGNALLSKVPVNRWSIKQLPDQTGKQFRNLITAFITLEKTEVAILITHLHTKKGRDQQLKVVLDEFSHYDHAILMGDFNTTADNALLQKVLRQPEYQDAVSTTLPDIKHQDRIDWLLVKGLHIHNGKYEPIGVSDHPYFEIEVSL